MDASPFREIHHTTIRERATMVTREFPIRECMVVSNILDTKYMLRVGYELVKNQIKYTISCLENEI